MRSDATKMMKKTSVKSTPLTVATSFVIRLTPAIENRITAMTLNPRGNSLAPRRTLRGTFHSRCDVSLNRSTSIASPLKANDQMTPNAYASPSVYVLPRDPITATSCRMTIRLIIR